MAKVRGQMPQHCLEYGVKDSDTLERIAARFDSTPSELIKLNRLPTRMVFEGQVLFVPDPANPAPPPVPKRGSTNFEQANRPQSMTSEPGGVDTTTPLIADTKSMKQDHYGSELKKLESAERVLPDIPDMKPDLSSSIPLASTDKGATANVSPTVDSELDAECLQRFIKLNVRHFTESEGVVSGTLLVTPNCIMFDPDLNHPLVVENGSDKYGVIVKMEHVMSAGLYTDVSAMTLPTDDSHRKETFFESSGEHSIKRSSSTAPTDDEPAGVIGCKLTGTAADTMPSSSTDDHSPRLSEPVFSSHAMAPVDSASVAVGPVDFTTDSSSSSNLLNGGDCAAESTTSGDPDTKSASQNSNLNLNSHQPSSSTMLPSAAIVLDPSNLSKLTPCRSLPQSSSSSADHGKTQLSQRHSFPSPGEDRPAHLPPTSVHVPPPQGDDDMATTAENAPAMTDSGDVIAVESGGNSTNQNTDQPGSLVANRMTNIPEVLEPEDVHRLLSAKVNPRRRFVSETDLSPSAASNAWHNELKSLCDSAQSGISEEGTVNGAGVELGQQLDVGNQLANQATSCVSCPSSLEKALSDQKSRKVGFASDDVAFDLGNSAEDDMSNGGNEEEWDDANEKNGGFIGRRLGNLRSSVKRRKDREATRLKTMRTSFSRSMSTSASKVTDVIGTGASTVGGALTTGATHVGGALTTGANQVGGALTSGATQVGGALTTGATHVGGALTTGATQVGGALTSGAVQVGDAVTAIPKTIAQVPVNIVNMSTGLFSTDTDDGDFESGGASRVKPLGVSGSQEEGGRFMEVREAWFGEGLSPQTKDRLNQEIEQRRQRSFAKLEELKQKAAHVRSKAVASQQLASSTQHSLGGSPRSIDQSSFDVETMDTLPSVQASAEPDREQGHLDPAVPSLHRPQDIKFKCATSQEEGPDLVTPLELLLPSRGHQPLNTQMPYFFCLKVDKKKRKKESCAHGDSGQLVAVFEYQNRNEYWFTCPREKADSLYMFFIQWSPEKYTNEEDPDQPLDSSPQEGPSYRGGFVIIDSDEESADLLDKNSPFGPNSLTSHLVPGSLLNREWEIVTVEEVKRRLSLADIIDISKFPLPEGSTESAILSDEQIRQIVSILPARAEGYPWVLVYSSQEHGFSLRTLFRNMTQWGEDISPTLLVIESVDEGVFGAVCSNPLKLSEHFYGTGESLLFSFVPEFQEYRWSGDNNFFLKGSLASLAIGAGKGKFGLWLDGDLYHGRTQECETFMNPPLTAGAEDFLINRVEAWGFKML